MNITLTLTLTTDQAYDLSEALDHASALLDPEDERDIKRLGIISVAIEQIKENLA